MSLKTLDVFATQNAKNVILRKSGKKNARLLYNDYYSMEKDAVTGIVQKNLGRNISINLGKVDAILNESQQVKVEVSGSYGTNQGLYFRSKAYVPRRRVSVSRTHPGFGTLFESEVAELKDGTVEIKAIAREAGSRT